MIAPRIIPYVLHAAFLSVLAGCSGSPQKTEETQRHDLKILCTVLPVYVLAQNVVEGSSAVMLQLLLSPQVGCPHDYALTPRDAAMLENADVLVMNGLGLESFLRENPALARTGLAIIEVASAVDSVVSLDEHGGNGANPHAWVSPVQAKEMAIYLGAELGKIDTANTSLYESNARDYAAKLDSLGQALRQVVMKASNRGIVTYHNAFDYFARDLGLTVLGIIELDPAEEPSARALSELANRIRATKPAAIFSEPQYSESLPKMMSEETGVPHYMLDPAASGDSDADSYLRIMRQNLLILEKALK